MTKEQILQQAFQLYNNTYGVSSTLGQCIRVSCSQFGTKEHSILSKLDGSCAVDYFHRHYSDDLEQQLNLEGI